MTMFLPIDRCGLPHQLVQHQSDELTYYWAFSLTKQVHELEYDDKSVKQYTGWEVA